MLFFLQRMPVRPLVTSFITFLIGLSVLGLATPCFAQSQQGTNIIPSEKTLVFRDVLQQIADKYRIAVIAEGTPLFNTIPESVLAKITPKGSEAEVLFAIATAYDYDCVRRRPGLYILLKRYSDPRDLPGVMPEELYATLKDIQNLLKPFAPIVPTSGELVREVYSALTAKQIEQMTKRELKVADLLPQQQAMFRKTVNYLSIGLSTDSFNSGTYQLEQALTASLCYGTEHGKDVFGYRFFSPTPQSKQQQFTSFGPRQGEPPITTTPEVDSADWAKRFNQTETLGQLCKRLSVPGGVRFTVKPELFDKPITVLVGQDTHFAPDSIVATVATVYGIDFYRLSSSEVVLRRHIPQTVKEVSQIPAALRAMIPAPFLRAFRIREIDPKTRPFTPWSANPRYSEYEIGENVILLGREARRLLAHAFNAEMYRRAEKGDAVEEIPVSQLDQFCRAALSAIFCFEPFAGTEHLVTSPPDAPPYVTQFDNLIVRGEQFEEKGIAQISFQLLLRDPQTGKLSRYATFWGPAVDPSERKEQEKP
jgi:hypothetical protein